jgi:hypothetical protein
MPKFGEAVISGDEKSSIESFTKWSSPTNQDEEDMDVALKLLKRSIKIEKLIYIWLWLIVGGVYSFTNLYMN